VMFDGLPIQVVCQYELGGHSAAEIHAALRTHPLVHLEGRAIANPNDQGPEILAQEPFLNEPDPDPTKVAAMIEALRHQV